MIIKRRNKKKNKVETNLSPLLNEDIRFSQILLVGEGEKKIVTRQEALAQAKEAGLDLLCVAPSVNPPVCKLVNYYRLSKELKRKRKGREKREESIDISFNIKENDLKTKLNKILSWVEKGSTARVNLVRKGKERSREKEKLALEKCHDIIYKLKNNFPKIELKNGVQQHLNNFYFLLYKKK